LRQAIPDLVTRLVAPYCIDAADPSRVLGPSTNGACAQGRLEFAPVQDLHIAAVSTSLGGRGSDVCDGTDAVGAGATRHDDDGAHLLTRAGSPEHALEDASDGVLAFGPGNITDPNVLRSDVQDLIAGVGEYGCGLEAQLESWYRFLVQPDPYARI